MNMPAKLPDPASLSWYECSGMYLAIDRSASVDLQGLALGQSGQAGVPDLVDAVLLYESEPLLKCLDAWCETELDWKPFRPTDEQGGHADFRQQHSASAGSAHPAPSSVKLHELQGYPELTAALLVKEGRGQTVWVNTDGYSKPLSASFPKSWLPVLQLERYQRSGVVILDSLRLSEKESAKLDVGAVILFAGSQRPVWQLGFNLPGSGIERLNATLDANGAALRLAPQQVNTSPTPENNAFTLDVELSENLSINLLYMHSIWQAGSNMVLPLSAPLDGSRLSIKQTMENGEQRDWAARVITIGSACGAILEAAET